MTEADTGVTPTGLNRERVVRTKPMTRYHHVKNKDAILDGMVDSVFAEIDRPPDDLPWRDTTALRVA